MMQKISLFLLRLSLGWYMFYAGITKVMDPAWTAADYIKSAKHLTSFYEVLASAPFIHIVDLMNKWGLTLLGLSLITGLFLRLSAPLGIILMGLYYLALDFPYPNPHALVVDEHIIYAAALFVLASTGAHTFWTLRSFFRRQD